MSWVATESVAVAPVNGTVVVRVVDTDDAAVVPVNGTVVVRVVDTDGADVAAEVSISGVVARAAVDTVITNNA